jgi:phosphoglycerol transferase MdoB-like AlkP superfamily enzyme
LNKYSIAHKLKWFKNQYHEVSHGPIATIANMYLLILASFALFRVLLFLTELNRIHFNEDGIQNTLLAFGMGLRFDLVISGYILGIPALTLFVLDVFKIKSRVVNRLLTFYIMLLLSLSFLIAAADIPYFNQFFSRFSVTAFEWLDSPHIVFGMIIQELKYLLFALPFGIVVYVNYLVLRMLLRNNQVSEFKVAGKVLLYLCALSFIFLGIRGRITKKSPIRIGTAYFSDNAFLNQLGLNPVFTLMDSYFESLDPKNAVVQLMQNDSAIEEVQGFLKIENSEFESPIARHVIPEENNMLDKPNVVIVIMESMSAAKMKRHGSAEKLTPFLDSLSHQGIYFDHHYTAGKHTFNGIFSTLFSFPALFRQHPMKAMNKFYGISSVLKNHDYQTIYFTTHDGQFDNVEGFLKHNDFDKVVSQKDYPSSEIKTTLGVPDDYLFSFSIPMLNELASNNKPFLSVFMTASDHPPYYIPKYFTPNSKETKNQIIEYADWSLRQFMHQVSQQTWFDNTLFVFVADHGAPLGGNYEISLNYHHSPLLFVAPKLISKPKTVLNMASQTDVFPTIMGLLQLPYINNTLGIDLLKEKRDFVLINDDDKVGVLDKQYILILKKGSEDQLYQYRNGSKINLAKEQNQKTKEMRKFAHSQMQVFQQMLLNKQTQL